MVLGTPDLYAADLLPPILNMFRQAFLLIRVEPRYVLSTPLVNLVKRRRGYRVSDAHEQFHRWPGSGCHLHANCRSSRTEHSFDCLGSSNFLFVCEIRPVGAISIRFSTNRLKSLVEPRGIEPLTS